MKNKVLHYLGCVLAGEHQLVCYLNVITELRQSW